MRFGEKFELDIVVDARQEWQNETMDWHDQPLRVASRWYAGTDQEKYEVLAGLRRLYNPCARANIRGTRRWSPGQIARAEGFSLFRYRRAAAPSSQDSGEVTIVQ